MAKPLKKYLDDQLKENKQKNLLYSNPEAIFQINSEFLQKLKDIKRDPALLSGDLHKLIDYTAENLCEEIQKINQYIFISRNKLDQVKNIYHHSWKQIKKSDNIEWVLYHYHYPQLSKWLASIYPQQLSTALSDKKVIGSVLCEEYSSCFQLDLLQINPETLLQPILDIGCGKHAYLVRHLRELGIDARGVDRLLQKQNKFCIRKDWFSFEYEKEQWGTIISNAALSNHIIYAEKYDKTLLKKYETLFHSILQNLKIGGKFLYAPNISKFEKIIDQTRFSVQNRAIQYGFHFTEIVRKNR